MAGALMDELSRQHERVRQLAGLLAISELPGDRLAVGDCLKRNRARLALMLYRPRLERAGGGRELQAVDALLERLAGAGAAARERVSAPARWPRPVCLGRIGEP